MARKRSGARRPPPSRRSARRSRARPTAGFVGREGSPVLERYPPKDPALTVRGPPARPAVSEAAPSGRTSPAAAPPAPGSPSGTPPTTPPSKPGSLIALERPFDVDEFATLLGETPIRVTVPREELPEVLRRVTEFMGFGIYVYSISVRPAPGELLKSFLVELQRVDYSAQQRKWVPFEDRGTSDSPFGPSGTRT